MTNKYHFSIAPVCTVANDAQIAPKLRFPISLPFQGSQSICNTQNQIGNTQTGNTHNHQNAVSEVKIKRSLNTLVHICENKSSSLIKAVFHVRREERKDSDARGYNCQINLINQSRDRRTGRKKIMSSVI